jgi:hypothetical protein
MNEAQNPARGVIPASFIVLFSMTIAGILVKQARLEPIRPVEREAAIDVPQWEDPFLSTQKSYEQWLAAALSERTLPAWEEPGTIADLRQEIERKTAPELGEAAAKSLDIVPVLTASGLSHSSIEVRRRQRVALSTAMVSHRFAPESPNRLSYLAAVLPGTLAGSKALVVPYEWFTRADSRESKLVLWLQGDALSRSQFGYRDAFGFLVNSILPDSLHDPDLPQKRIRVQVIGPASSGELRALAEKGPDRTAEYAKYRRVSSDRNAVLTRIRRLALMLPESDTAPVAQPTPDDGHVPNALDRARTQLRYASEAESVIAQALALYSVEQMKEKVLSYLDSLPPNSVESALETCISELLGDAGSNERSTRSIRALQRVSNLSISTVATPDPIIQFRHCLEDLGITDRDPAWESRVAELLAGKTSVMIAVRNRLGGRQLTNTDRMILLAEGYLDAGWSETYELSRALTDTLDSICASNADFAAERADFQRQLRESLPSLYDTDENWSGRLADLYVASCPGFSGGEVTVAAPLDSGEEGLDEVVTSTSARPAEFIIRLADFEYFSPLATMPDKVLFGETTPPKSTGEHVGVSTFLRVIATDDVVLEALFVELKNRGVDICSETIPLILQGDSVYGRESVNAAITAAGCASSEPRIEQHYYFSRAEGSHDRGGGEKSATTGELLLTGQLPDDPAKTREGNFPAGPHQLDYIARLADQFSQRNIRVIGIIGGDIYDKQLIIQALRQRNSTAVIFTTDADAIYEYPKFFRSNRNLLLASSYGLTVPLRFNRRADDSACEASGAERFPSRDNYQSSFYAAAQAMLVGCEVKPPTGLFEVGNSGMLLISKTDATPGIQTTSEASYHRYLRVVFLLAPMILLAWLSLRGVAMLKPLQDRSFRLTKRVYLWSAIVSVLTLILLGSALLAWNSASREPLYLFEGISSVPTLVMRINAMLLAIFLIAYLFARLRINNAALESYFRLPPYEEPGIRAILRGIRRNQPPWIWKWSVDLYALRHRAARVHNRDWQPPDATDLWIRYRMLGSNSARLLRTLLFAVPVLVLTFYFVFTVQPQPPLTRDPSNAFLIVSSLSVIASILAVVMAGDALKLCTVFVHYLQFDFFHWTTRPQRDSYVHLDDYVADRLCSIEMIMRRTETLRLVIILPAIVLFLQIFARSTLFEGWVWTVPVIVIYVYFIAYVFFRSMRLQQAANAARASILVDLERRKSVLSGEAPEASPIPQEGRGSDKNAGRIEDTIKYIRNIRRGAFQPLLDHPIFQAIAWPSTALGIIALTQALL